MRGCGKPAFVAMRIIYQHHVCMSTHSTEFFLRLIYISCVSVLRIVDLRW